MFDYEVLKLTWWVLIGVLLIGFALTDGFDMGAMILMPLIGKTDKERRAAINSIAPHWDGNQVWFITAGGALFAAWPLVYATAFSGLYWALLLVLFALFLRPVGFDYRSKLDNTLRAAFSTYSAASYFSRPWHVASLRCSCHATVPPGTLLLLSTEALLPPPLPLLASSASL